MSFQQHITSRHSMLFKVLLGILFINVLLNVVLAQYFTSSFDVNFFKVLMNVVLAKLKVLPAEHSSLISDAFCMLCLILYHQSIPARTLWERLSCCMSCVDLCVNFTYLQIIEMYESKSAWICGYCLHESFETYNNDLIMTFHYLSWTDLIKPSLQFLYFYFVLVALERSSFYHNFYIHNSGC